VRSIGGSRGRRRRHLGRGSPPEPLRAARCASQCRSLHSEPHAARPHENRQGPLVARTGVAGAGTSHSLCPVGPMTVASFGTTYRGSVMACAGGQAVAFPRIREPCATPFLFGFAKIGCRPTRPPAIT